MIFLFIIKITISVMETVHAQMEDSVYSIHLLIIILVIVLVLDTRESTVLVSASSGLDVYYTSLKSFVITCWTLVCASLLGLACPCFYCHYPSYV